VFLGVAVGAALAGKFMQDGRRRIIMIAVIIGLVGTCLNQVPNIWFLLVSRIIAGVANGMMSPAVPRYIEEYVPPHLVSTNVAIHVICVALGALLANLGGLLLPPDDANSEELLNDTMWRYLFAFPVLPLGLLLIYLLLDITGESPKFLLM